MPRYQWSSTWWGTRGLSDLRVPIQSNSTPRPPAFHYLPLFSFLQAKHPWISYADLWILASYVALETTSGPRRRVTGYIGRPLTGCSCREHVLQFPKVWNPATAGLFGRNLQLLQRLTLFTSCQYIPASVDVFGYVMRVIDKISGRLIRSGEWTWDVQIVWKHSQPIGDHPLADTLFSHIAWKYKPSQPIGEHPLWPCPDCG